MPKLYTKSGDSGITRLYDGTKIQKSSYIFDVLGNIDELSSQIGILCTLILSHDQDLENIKILESYLRIIQIHLLHIGSYMSIQHNNKKKEKFNTITQKDITEIEGWIDKCESKNTKLTSFLLPGTR